MSDSLPEQVAALCARVDALRPETCGKPTLIYFDIIGIAWPIRCLLHLRGVDYELVQVPIAHWAYRDESGVPVLKHRFVNGHLPRYVDPDISLNQSQLIMSYLADKHGLDGESERERYAVAEVMHQAYDALFHWNGLFPVMIKLGVPADVVDARLDAFMGKGRWAFATDGYENNLRAFERYLQGNAKRSGYMVGDELTIADLCAFNVLCNWYKAFEPARFVAEHPQLEDYVQRIAAIARVADFIENVQEPTTWFRLPQVAIRLTSPEELQSLVG